MAADVGTGKSIMALERAKRSGATKLLIIAPAPLVHTQQWQEEITKFGYEFDEIVVKSYHFLQTLPKGAERQFTDWYIIVDECQKLKQSESKQGKGGFRLLSANQRGYSLLSGTMMSKWHDAINYAKITKLVKNKTEFVRYFEDVVRYKGYPEIMGYRNTDTLKRWWLSVSEKLTADDCLDLPDQTTMKVRFNLPRTHYTRMVRERIDENGEILDSPSKLNHAKRSYCESSDEKIAWIIEKLESLPNGIVFVNYTKTVEKLSERLAKAKIKHGIWTGKQKDDFKKYDYMIIQYQAGGTGLNLQKFNATIFASPTYSYQDYTQAIGRTHRSGQTKKTVFYQLVAARMIDENVYRKIDEGKDFNDNLESED